MSMLFKRIKDWATSITAFRTGDVIPVDGPSGTAKMSKDDLLKETACNALGSVHSLSGTASEANLGAENYFVLDGSAGPKKLPANAIAGAGIKNKFGESVTETIDGNRVFHFIDVIKIGEKSVYFRFTCESPFVAQLWDNTEKKFDILESGYLYKINTESFVGTCKLYVYTTDSSTDDARVDTYVESELFNESKRFSKELFDVLGSGSIEKENVVYTDHVYNISGDVGDTASLIEYTLPNYSGVIVDVEEKNVTAFNITGICTSSVIGTFTILDKNNVILQKSTDAVQYDHHNIILPKNAKYIVISALTLYDYECILFKAKVLAEDKKIEIIRTELDGQYAAADVLEYKNGFVDSIGVFDYREEGEGYIANVYSVSGVKKIRLKSSVAHNARYASFYAGEPSTLNPSISFVTFDRIDDVIIDVPVTAVYFIVNSVFGNVGSVNDVSVLEQTEEGMKDRLDTLENVIIDWSDKTWLMIGDSLTEKNFRAQVSYYDYVKQVTNVNLLNKGRSGNGYVDGDWFYTALGQVSADSFDFCTIFGSGNDLRYEITSLSDKSSWEEALGNVNDNGTMSICGYMNRAISRFFELFPLKRIGIVTPTKWKNASYGAAQMTDEETLRRMTDYSRVLVQIANKWGIPVLDLFHTSGLQPQIEAYRLEFYIENGVQDPGVHPNSKGHKLIYKQFMDFIDVNLVS